MQALINNIIEYLENSPNNEPLMLGFCGYANSGKTTLCNNIKKNLNASGYNVLHYEGDWRFKLNSIARKQLILTPEDSIEKYIYKVNQINWWDWTFILSDLLSIKKSKSFAIDFGYNRKTGDFGAIQLEVTQIDVVLFDCSIIASEELIKLFEKIFIINTSDRLRLEYTFIKDGERRNVSEIAARFLFTNYFETVGINQVICLREDIIYLDNQGNFTKNIEINLTPQFPIPIHSIIEFFNAGNNNLKSIIQIIKSLLKLKEDSQITLSNINSNQKTLFVAEFLNHNFTFETNKAIIYIVSWVQEYSSGEAFVRATELLSKYAISVPKIIVYDKLNGLIIQEYISNIRLIDEFIKCSNSINKIELIKKAINITLKYEGIDTNSELPKYTISILMEELKRFHFHFFCKLLNCKLKDIEETFLFEFYKWLCDEISHFEKGIALKDFNSKNILVKDNELYVIDFQEVCIGASLYDLSSLIFDPYLELDSNTRKELMQYSYNISILRKKMTFKDFEYQIRMISIHRSLKGIGSFSSFVFRKGNVKNVIYINSFKQILKENSYINNKIKEFYTILDTCFNSIL